MTVADFLAWLHVTDLGDATDDEIREVLEKVLDAAPDEVGELGERLLEELEDQLELPLVNLDLVMGWPARFPDLLPPGLASFDDVDEGLEPIAQESPSEEKEGSRLLRFQVCLAALAAAPDKPAMAEALAQLHSLEQDIATAWEEYTAEPFSPQAGSAESVAGHRFLGEGFECWFQALDLAKVGQAEEALASAREGNRLFRAVARWSDDLTSPECRESS